MGKRVKLRLEDKVDVGDRTQRLTTVHTSKVMTTLPDEDACDTEPPKTAPKLEEE